MDSDANDENEDANEESEGKCFCTILNFTIMK